MPGRSDAEYGLLLEGKTIHVISSIPYLKKRGTGSHLLEQKFKVSRFVRALQPEGNRKRLLLVFHAWDEHDWPVMHKDLKHIGGRKHTIAADDIAEIG